MPDGNDPIQLDVIDRISHVSRDDWDACALSENPFVCHGFLSALEDSGSANGETGWQPQHLLIRGPDGTLHGAVPLYLKSHSYGEYVFDWAWADAYARSGHDYYPKLQCAVPFTPATGPRLLIHPQAPHNTAQILTAGMVQLAQQSGVSSLHITFPTQPEWAAFGASGLLQRTGLQYHWENRNYADFEEFLSQLSSRKRKAIRKERRAITDQEITMRVLRGAEISADHWAAFYTFYRNTVDKKWGGAYLKRPFFTLLGERLGDKVVLILAEHDGEIVAGALNLIGGDTLYGRNWGCNANYKFLHFETCYYQAIDFAINNGLKWVEAGAQGQHKVQRGYLAEKTYSAHWIADRGFRNAVARYLVEEQAAIDDEIAETLAASPYRQDVSHD